MTNYIATDGSGLILKDKYSAGFGIILGTPINGIAIFGRVPEYEITKITILDKPKAVQAASLEMNISLQVNNKYTNPTNNRGELLAIAIAVELICNSNTNKNIYIISDSQYSIKTITQYYPTWLKYPNKLEGKKNLDLLKLIHKNINKKKIEFIHINSHQKIPSANYLKDKKDYNNNEFIGLNNLADIYADQGLKSDLGIIKTCKLNYTSL